MIVLGLLSTARAQTVDAPMAQSLVEAALRAHPEMQTMGIHLQLPGQTQNTNIACSKPWKVGKVSAPIELEVMRTGTPYLRHTELGAIDMGLTLPDRAGRSLGMVVIVLRKTFTQVDATALARATVIRDELAAAIPDQAALLAGARIARGPLYLTAQVPLPEMTGPVDGLAVSGSLVWVRAAKVLRAFTFDGEPVADTRGPARWADMRDGVVGEDRAAGVRFLSGVDGLTTQVVTHGRWKTLDTFPNRGAVAVLWEPTSERLFAAYAAHNGEEAGLLVYRVFR